MGEPTGTPVAGVVTPLVGTNRFMVPEPVRRSGDGAVHDATRADTTS